jgi:DNA mismatch repair protein MutL
MGIRIHQLPKTVANQIAAGEVIERPASVVKELLENALDAKASVINVDIGFGGLNHIKISDNGTGIIAEDLPLAISAHATSKITTLNDLYAIESMGFRGEALASIASVSKLSISSRPLEQDQAAMLCVTPEGLTNQPCARSFGTTVEVVDLFYNVPVRKRFLKGEQLEFQAIEIVVKRFALSAPHIAVTLKHNNALVLTLPAANNEAAIKARLTKIFGSTFVKEAIHLDVARSGMRMTGWISGIGLQRSQNDRQWVYINRRMVKDKLIHHALKQAYDGLLHPGRFPSCLLYFNISEAEVDVNVHPTKHEVRFLQPRLVHDFFTSQITLALDSLAPPSQIPLSRDKEDTFMIPLHIHEPRIYAPDASDAIVTNWVMLNARYGLVFIQGQPLLVDVFGLYGYWLNKQLLQTPLPLAQRPLLAPISCVFPKTYTQQHIRAMIECLYQFGIVLDETKNHQTLMRTIPVQMPYLEIHQLFSTLASCVAIDNNMIREHLCRAQVFDWGCVSLEERVALEAEITPESLEHLKTHRVCRPLCMDLCRMIVHA